VSAKESNSTKSSRTINQKTSETVPYGPVTVKENLPLPYVHYPHIYGTFISFSSEIDSERYLCECFIPALENYFIIQGKPLSNTDKRFEYNFSVPIDLKEPIDLSKFKFKNKICHRCNLATPSAKYCHEMYGSQFKQFYGWYISQNAYKFGIGHFMYKQTLFSDKYPDELKILYSKRVELDVRINELENTNALKTHRENLRIRNYYYEIGDDDRKLVNERYELNKVYQKIGRKIDNFSENATRQDFGFSKIGESWLAESILHNIIKRIFENHDIIRHYRPNWLNKLELDIYLPHFSLGIEYQGQQHYFPIKAWGGQRSFEALLKRDKLKKELCINNKISLVEFNYTEPLTEKYVMDRISKYIYPSDLIII